MGVTPHIRRLRDSGILVPCQFPWNTCLLPIEKLNSNDYRPVQDLREVNSYRHTFHGTKLSSLESSKSWFTVLDLKGAFFSLPLDPPEPTSVYLGMARPGEMIQWTTNMDQYRGEELILNSDSLTGSWLFQ